MDDTPEVVSSSFSFHHLHVAILSSPGTGHFTPVLVLANRLAAHYALTVTVLLVTTAADHHQSQSKLPRHHARVRVIRLPPIDIQPYLHLHPPLQVFSKLCLFVRHALPSIRSTLAAIHPRPDAFISSHFAHEALAIAADLGIPKYVYFPSSAWFTALTIYCPILDREIKGEFVDHPGDGFIIPGCKPVRPQDVVDPMLDRKDQQYNDYVQMGTQIPLFDGILINSWQALEPATFRAFRENETLKSIVKIPVYPIGPLTKPPLEPADPKSDVTAWLDRQPNESVIFVSFGSGGMLSAEQITELAWGLELSGHRFLWVIRRPTNGPVDDAFFGVTDGGGGVPDYLPDGFRRRTGDVGLLVWNWAPQVEILKHPAVGGFLSHCGWNSSLESMSSGVPMIAWPLYAEQKMNAALLVEEAGVGVAVRVSGSPGIVGREEIEKVLRALMEEKGVGVGVRRRVKALQQSGAGGLMQGGASDGAMCELLSRISLSKAIRQMNG